VSASTIAPVRRLALPTAPRILWPLGGWLRRLPPEREHRLAGVMQRAQPHFVKLSMYDGPKGLSLICSLDDTPNHGILLHVSFSYAERMPGWDEIAAVKHALFPADVDAMMMLPAAEDYVNLHPRTLHVIQTPSRWGLR
jgi:hypothetical protein